MKEDITLERIKLVLERTHTTAYQNQCMISFILKNFELNNRNKGK